MSAITATLENWYPVQCTSKEMVIYGACYGDIHGRFPDGELIHTSGVKNRPLNDGDVVKTRNSTYKLGEKAK